MQIAATGQDGSRDLGSNILPPDSIWKTGSSEETRS